MWPNALFSQWLRLYRGSTFSRSSPGPLLCFLAFLFISCQEALGCADSGPVRLLPTEQRRLTGAWEESKARGLAEAQPPAPGSNELLLPGSQAAASS